MARKEIQVEELHELKTTYPEVYNTHYLRVENSLSLYLFIFPIFLYGIFFALYMCS